MRIRLLVQAEKDLEAGYLFYQRQGRDLGQYFLDALYADIESLRLYAGVHVKERGFYKMLSKRFPFAIYYGLDDDQIVIKAILDCRRDPEMARSRLGRI